MDEKTIVINPDSQNPVVVSRSVYRGEARLDVRRYYTADDGELRPTRKGVSLSIGNGLAGQVLEAIQEVMTGSN